MILERFQKHNCKLDSKPKKPRFGLWEIYHYQTHLELSQNVLEKNQKKNAELTGKNTFETHYLNENKVLVD
jgi:hypothetical protein